MTHVKWIHTILIQTILKIFITKNIFKKHIRNRLYYIDWNKI